MNSIFGDKVAYEADSSLAAISKCFRCNTRQDGANNYGISILRDEIAKLGNADSDAYSLMIVAPHTHWRKPESIVYRFDAEHQRYLIQNQTLRKAEGYLPVSFVFSDDGPLPYEWTDNSIFIDRNEYDRAYRLISELNSIVASFNWPLGISIDFRFKKSLFSKNLASIETDSEFEDVLQIRLRNETSGGDGFVQVSWPAARMSPSSKLSEREYHLLLDLESSLSEIEDEQKRICSLESMFA